MVCQKFLMTGFDLQASAGWEASLVCLQWQFNIYIILNENVFSYFDQSKNDEVYSQSCLHLIFSLRLDKGTVWSPILRRNFQRKYTMCNFNITIFYWIGPGEEKLCKHWYQNYDYILFRLASNFLSYERFWQLARINLMSTINRHF